MISPRENEPQAVADKVLKRAELSKMARNLQNRLALAQFKTKHGWEDLALDKIEPKVEQELRRKRALEVTDSLSDSSSSTSELPPYPSRALMSSPLKAPPPLFSDAVTGPSSSSTRTSTGHRKRTYHAFESAVIFSSPSKRFRLSPTPHCCSSSSSASTGAQKLRSWRSHQNLAPPTTAAPSSFLADHDSQDSHPNFNPPLTDSEDEDNLLPAHSFHPSQMSRSSPPTTPPLSTKGISGRSRAAGTTSEEGADLLLHLAASPSPAPSRRLKAGNSGTTTLMEPPSTPPSRVVRQRVEMDNTPALPSSMMTPSGLFPATPGQPTFDISDFVNITPSPAQKPWKTPLTAGGNNGRTPRVGTTRGKRLTFDDMPQ